MPTSMRLANLAVGVRASYLHLEEARSDPADRRMLRARRRCRAKSNGVRLFRGLRLLSSREGLHLVGGTAARP